MKKLHLTDLNGQDRAAFHAITAFLNGRLEDQATIDWALRLKRKDTIKRLALLNLIDSPNGREIGEPWRSAWRLIDESWDGPISEDQASVGRVQAQLRIQAGERSGALIAAIVELVAPRLKVEPFSDLQLHYRKLPKHPRRISDLFSPGLSSGNVFDPCSLGLGSVNDRTFLLSLANALDAAVIGGMDIARRIGWDGEQFWKLGDLHRVYYVPAAERPANEHEPDKFHRGIAPSVKLLHAVISRLVDVDISAAIEFVRRWKLTNSPIHLRLWAALAQDPHIVSTNEVNAFLMSLGDRSFWNLHDYPEPAELRAKRYSELDSSEQAALTARIRKRPPRNQWPRKTEINRVENARLYCAVRELRRIEVAGAVLSQYDKAWLDAKVTQFPELAAMTQLQEDFMGSPKAEFVSPNPDSRYDLLCGEDRLKALEIALSSKRGGWNDDPAERASDWMRQPGNVTQILADLESIPDGGAAVARVWELFGRVHSPATEQSEEAAPHDLSVEAGRVLTLLAKLPETTTRQAIDGISHWFSVWQKQVVVLSDGPAVWLKLWPIAVEATNAKQLIGDQTDLNKVATPSADREPMDLDTLNTPAGKFIGVFLVACPTLQEEVHPFDAEGAPRAMRDAITTTTGRSLLIARYRMIEILSYFLRADPDWTHTQLIQPLSADSEEAMILWRAIARRTRFSKVLKIIGGQMSERATDRRLGRKTRQSLVFSLVVECLHALREQREPAVPYTRIQQMIRSVDDEIRAYGAGAIQRFMHEVLAPHERLSEVTSPEDLFRSAVAPFLKDIWPQERSLATPGVSRALARLPATVPAAFAEAVGAIERFLAPFECWLMHEYGFSGEAGGGAKLSDIDDSEKAAAFLRLLDLTIGVSEGAVIPYDLADALDQIRRVGPTLAEKQEFRRLATSARRS